ncbi:MAG: DUF4037 domain-containing protein [Deltaproteobacteria bacterium]|jgi:hypothetical protein|nr:DUF4037 domain-containing protein [Deltaproteobacteria bacterium]
MKGLALSELYYRECCIPMLEGGFPALVGRIAAGLVGEGSECLGFDDELSRDHDWGAAICLWLRPADCREYGEALRRALDALPKTVGGFPVREESPLGAGRTGVWDIGRFYFRYLGHGDLPPTPADWLKIPEEHLATATNGAVFADPCGEFTRIREGLLAFYPEDVRLKKLAARCLRMAQAGQYNFPRCVARGEYVAAAAAEAEFVHAACSAAFLLNRRYKPFYKWMHKALTGLPTLGAELFPALDALVEAQAGDKALLHKKKIENIEKISAMFVRELERQGLSSARSDFLLEHGYAVQRKIRDKAIRDVDAFLG